MKSFNWNAICLFKLCNYAFNLSASMEVLWICLVMKLALLVLHWIWLIYNLIVTLFLKILPIQIILHNNLWFIFKFFYFIQFIYFWEGGKSIDVTYVLVGRAFLTDLSLPIRATMNCYRLSSFARAGVKFGSY